MDASLTQQEKLQFQVQQLQQKLAEKDAEINTLKKLLKGAYHLFKRSDAIYDSRGDIAWLKTRDQWLEIVNPEGELIDRTIREDGAGS